MVQVRVVVQVRVNDCTYKIPPAQRNSGARTIPWECTSAEPLITGFVVPEEPVPPADDSEHPFV